MAKPVSDETQRTLYEYGRLGREALKSGDTSEAERYFLEMWAALPEPKVEYDFAQSISVGMVKFYRDHNDVGKALNWLEVAREAYGPDVASDSYLGFLAGTVYFCGGDFDKAYKEFDWLFEKYKARPFQGEDDKYLHFYMNKKREQMGKRNGA